MHVSYDFNDNDNDFEHEFRCEKTGNAKICDPKLLGLLP